MIREEYEALDWIPVKMGNCPYTTIVTKRVGTITFQGTDIEIAGMIQRTFGQGALSLDCFTDGGVK